MIKKINIKNKNLKQLRKKNIMLAKLKNFSRFETLAPLYKIHSLLAHCFLKHCNFFLQVNCKIFLCLISTKLRSRYIKKNNNIYEGLFSITSIINSFWSLTSAPNKRIIDIFFTFGVTLQKQQKEHY